MNWNIFATIAKWLKNIGQGVVFWAKEIIRVLTRFFTTIWGVILILASCVWIAIKDMALMMGQLIGFINGLAGNAPGLPQGSPGGSGFTHWLAVANTFGPLDETVGYIIIYVHIAAGFGLYKLIKSWLPEAFGWSVGQGSGS